jgi:hypothetical protein
LRCINAEKNGIWIQTGDLAVFPSSKEIKINHMGMGLGNKEGIAPPPSVRLARSSGLLHWPGGKWHYVSVVVIVSDAEQVAHCFILHIIIILI